MKKLLFCLFALLASLSVNAQDVSSTYELQQNGTFKTADGKGFVVVSIEDKTQLELYNLVKGNLMKIFKSPQDVLSENAPHAITVFYREDLCKKKIVGVPCILSGDVNWNIQFKDGRIRVDAPTMPSTVYSDLGNRPFDYASMCIKGIFKKDGSVKDEERKAHFDKWANDFITSLVKGVSTNNTEEDW